MIEQVLVWLLFEDDGAALVAQRKASAETFAGKWTLPGDLMREEESASETIERVGREELDIRVIGEEFVDTLSLNDSGVEYAVNVFRVTSYGGRPRFRESGPYGEVRWLLASELNLLLSLPEPLKELLGGLGTKNTAG